MKENNKRLDRTAKVLSVSKERQWINAEQARALYSQGLLSMLGTFLFSTILVIGLRTVVPHQPLLIWFCLLILLTALRYLSFLAFRRKSNRFLSSHQWVDLFAFGQLLNGLLWGASLIWLFPDNFPLHQALIIILIAGMVAGGLQAYSSVFRVFLAFTVPAMIPLIIRLFITSGNIHKTLGIAGLLFTLIVIVTARRLSHIAVSGLRLQFENRELIEFLTVEKERVESLNRDLASRIKEQEQTEIALRGSEERYRTVFENTGTATLIIEEDMTISMINTECEKLIGYSKQKVEGKLSWKDFVAEEDLERLKEYNRKRRIDGAVVPDEYELKLINKFGEMKDIWAKVALIPNTKKSVASLMDVTKRKQAEEALQESEERFRGLVEELPLGVAILREDGQFAYFNPGFIKMFGYSMEEIPTGREWFRKAYPDREYRRLVVSIWKSDLQKIKLGRPTSRTFDVTCKDGSQKTVLFRPVALEKGLLLVIYEDITERKQMIEALRKAKEEAESASRAKTDFLASMSHEIRTPMNAIIGMTDLLKETPLTEEQQKYVQVFSSAGKNLLSIINDILDISKVETGRLDLETFPFELDELAETTCEALAFRAQEKGIELTYRIQPDVPTALIGDQGRLRQILINLIGNAIKFTEEGEVRLEVERHGDGPGDREEKRVELVFSVSDTGMGIPEEKTKIIFDSFRQADSTITRKHGGTGLGLAISMKLVELMEGRIWVESEPGQGSTFYFTAKFPVQAGPEGVVGQGPRDPKGEEASAGQGRAMAQPTAEEPLPPLNILLVEDNEDNVLLIKSFLKKTPYELGFAENGEIAIEKFASGEYDLVLMDIQMPIMDGYTATRKIRKWEKDRGLEATPIVALTAYASQEERDRCIEAGCDAHLSKPVKKTELLEAIHEIWVKKG